MIVAATFRKAVGQMESVYGPTTSPQCHESCVAGSPTSLAPDSDDSVRGVVITATQRPGRAMIRGDDE